MNEAIASLANLTPLGAILAIAAMLQVVITQVAKQESWSKTRTERVAAGVATVLAILAALVAGLIYGIPDSVVQIVSSILLSIAAVVVLGRLLYGALGYAIPDGTKPETSTIVIDDATAAQLVQRGRYADRDGVMDGQVTPNDG